MKNFENFEVQELSIQEQKKIEGGNPLGGWIVGAILAFAYESASNPQATSAAFISGYQSTETRITLNF